MGYKLPMCGDLRPVWKGTERPGQARSSTSSLDVQERAQDNVPAQIQAPKLPFMYLSLNTQLLFKFVSVCVFLRGGSRKNKQTVSTASAMAQTRAWPTPPVAEFAVLNFLSSFT